MMNNIPEIRNILRACITRTGQLNSLYRYRAMSSQGDGNDESGGSSPSGKNAPKTSPGEPKDSSVRQSESKEESESQNQRRRSEQRQQKSLMSQYERRASQYERRGSRYERKPSEYVRRPSERQESLTSEYERKPSRYERRPSEYERRPSEYEQRSSEYERKPSRYERKPSEYERRSSEYERRPSESKVIQEDWNEKKEKSDLKSEIAPPTTPPGDPLNVYLKKEVQGILTRITYIEPAKYAYLRTARKQGVPRVKLLGEKNLAFLRTKTLMNICRQVIDNRPPVMNPRKSGARPLVNNPELGPIIDHKHIFLDISNKGCQEEEEKWMVVREKSGLLRTATHDERDRVMQMFFPLEGRRILIPDMFKGETLQEMMDLGKHAYVLERACLQFEPDDPFYVELTTKLYNHINDTRQYGILRHTRHYAPMAFYLAWNNKIEWLLADTMERGCLLDADDLVKLYYIVWNKKLSENLTMVKAVVAYFKFYCPAPNKEMLERSIQRYLDTYKDKTSHENLQNRKLLLETLRASRFAKTDPLYDRLDEFYS